MQRTKWTERKFAFDIPAGWLPDILERLYGSPLRIKHMVASVSEEQAALRPNDKWSIKENIGHLSDLEELHDGRIDDFMARKEILRAADMSNTKTYAASHNDRTLEDLLEEFSAKRSYFINRLQQLDDDTQLFRSLHPRLQTHMRPVDMAFFTAEHDDHHIADMRVILQGMFPIY